MLFQNVLEKKKTKGIMKMGQSRSGGVVITQKQGESFHSQNLYANFLFCWLLQY